MTTRPLSQMSPQEILEASSVELHEHIQLLGSEPADQSNQQAAGSFSADALRRSDKCDQDVSVYAGNDLLARQTVTKPATCLVMPDRPVGRAVVRAPIPWRGNEPTLRLARCRGWYGFDEIHPKSLVHALIVGASGSGKTESVVAPLLTSFLRYQLPCGKTTSMLVIDPKRDLEGKVHSSLTQQDALHRLVHIGSPDCVPVRFFDIDSPLTPREKLEHLATIADACGGTEDRNRYWVVLGLGLLGDLLTLEDLHRRCRHGAPLLAGLCRELEIVLPEETNFWVMLQALLGFARLSDGSLRRTSDRLEVLCTRLPHDGSKGVFAAYTASSLVEQFNYAVMSVDPLLKLLSDPDLSEVLDTDPWPNIEARRTDLAALIEVGAVVLFQPTDRPIDSLAAKAIKSRFYGAVFSRQDLERPVAVVIDEAQRYVNDGPEFGEARFVDRARAYRTNVVMATQSLSSIVHALGADQSARVAMEVLVANTPTKFFLQSKDSHTDAALRSLIAPSPIMGAPHVVDIRPPAQLKTGEAYWSFPDGRFGRGKAQLEHLL